MTTPHDVFGTLSDEITARNWEAIFDLYAEDAVVENPQRPPVPARFEGRETLRKNFSGGINVRMSRADVLIHGTTDPEVIIAEYRNVGEALDTGKSFDIANIQLLRVRDGLIAHSRDYHDYLRLTAARDGLEALKKSYETAEREITPVPPRPASTADPKSPRGVFERLAYGVADGDWAGLPELYAEETHVTHPFLPGAETLKSREDLREHFKFGERGKVRFQVRDLVIHETLDPEVVIGEFDYQGTVGDSAEFRVSNIFVLRVRDGLIVESRDYADHLALAAATGRLDDLLARVQDSA
ncbi:nuclear transport factor 2 family protein [Amycolatopsis alba]|uniref:Ketosteroid isomerase n=1 Tax=Amycolatopsis alba DSM 44262 TaxID=1125972 RepID=A0A229RJT4_AMYAL|nr:nuclear transport factor 2 family protein [Amycolatopsis alba]OXM46845.1 ketosteroid isomerase [Amycolatopsis alba DSM 44262]